MRLVRLRRGKVGIGKSVGKIKVLNVDILIFKIFIEFTFKLRNCRLFLEKKIMLEVIKYDFVELFNKFVFCGILNS